MITSLNSLQYEARLQKLGLWTLEERRNRADLIEVFKMAHGFSAIGLPLTDMFLIDTTGRTRGHSLKLPSQHSQTVPARVPYVIPHGARTGFPAGTRRFLSAGSRRVPGGIAHPVRYPYGSRLPKLVGTRTGTARDGLSHLGPVWIPRTKTAGYPPGIPYGPCEV